MRGSAGGADGGAQHASVAGAAAGGCGGHGSSGRGLWEEQAARRQEQLDEQRQRVWTGLTADSALDASASMEVAGGVVHAIALLVSLLRSQCPLSVVEIVRVKLRLGDLYHAYTSQPERARHWFQEAGSLLDQQPNLSSKATVLRVVISLRLASLNVRAAEAEGGARASREIAAAQQLVATAADGLLEPQTLHQLRAWLALASMQQLLLRDGIDAPGTWAEVENALRTCETAGGPEHVFALLLHGHMLLRYGTAEVGQEHGGRAVPNGRSRASDCLGAARQVLLALPQTNAPVAAECNLFDAGANAAEGLSKYLVVLTVLSHLMQGEMTALQTALKDEKTIALLSQRGTAHSRIAAEQVGMMWWHLDNASEAIICYARTVVLSANAYKPSAAAPAANSKGVAVQEALVEAERGLDLLGTPVGSGGSNGVAAAGTMEAGTLGPWAMVERSALRLLLLERRQVLLLWRGQLQLAGESLQEMIQCVERGLRGIVASADVDALVEQSVCAVHCAISAYLVRAGDAANADAHLDRALQHATHIGTRLYVMLLQAGFLLDDSMRLASGAAGGGEGGMSSSWERGKELLLQVEKCMAECAVEIDMSWAQGMCLFLRAHCFVRNASREDVGSFDQAKALLERCLALSEDSDYELQVKALVLLSDVALVLDEPVKARQYSSCAHRYVNLVGDEWMELRVLRAEERCYLQLPGQDVYAKASKKLRTSRERSVQEQVQAVLGMPYHHACVEWRVPL